jgi:hypothetical protein
MYDRPFFLVAQPDPGGKFQSEQHGYFAANGVDHAAANPVCSLAVGLKDGSRLKWMSNQGSDGHWIFTCSARQK